MVRLDDDDDDDDDDFQLETADTPPGPTASQHPPVSRGEDPYMAILRSGSGHWVRGRGTGEVTTTTKKQPEKKCIRVAERCHLK